MSIILTSCKSRTTTLFNGSYQDQSGQQKVTVSGTRIRFCVFLDGQSNFTDVTYAKHSVWPNGKIQPYPMREAEAILGVGRFEWTWDGKAIRRRNVKTDEILLFVRTDDNSRN